MRMLDDRAFKPSAQQAVAHWLYDTDPLSDMFDRPKLNYYLEAYANNSLPVQYEKLHRFANKQGKYVFGTPSASVIKDPKGSLLKASQRHLGISQSVVKDQHVSGVNGVYESLIKLETMGYNSKNKSLTLDGVEWTLERATVQLTKPFYDSVMASQMKMEDLGVEIEVNQSSSNSLVLKLSRQEQIEVPVENETEEEASEEVPVMQTKTITVKDTKSFGLTLKDDDKDHIYITYTKAGKHQYFTHTVGEGNYAIDTSFKAQEVEGDYYPRIYLRVNQVDTAEHTDEQYKKHTKNALRKVNMPLDGITKQLKKGIGDNYNDVRSVFMYMGARLKDVSDPEVAGYLFAYFERLHKKVGDKEFVQTIEDNVCKQTLVVSGITKQTQQGTFEKLKPNECGGVYIKGHEGVYWYEINQTVGKIPSVFKVIKQHNNSYTQYSIGEIRLVIEVAGFKATHITGDEELVIPVDRALVKQLPIKKREILLYKCLHIHILLVNKQEEAWWQTNLFKALVFAVGVALTVAFPPAGAGMTALIEAVAIASAKSLAIGLFTSTVMSTLIATGAIDMQTGAILMVIATVATAGYSGGTFSFANLATAPNMMRIINSSFDAYGKALNADIANIKQKIIAFDEHDKQRQDKLQDMQRLLDTAVFTPSQELLKSSYTSTVDLFDTPQLFYSRHRHYNVVGISLAMVSQYVRMTLQDKTSLLKTNTNEDIHTPLYL